MGSSASEINSANGVKTLQHMKHGKKPKERFWKPDG
jgi:hypothetical protein